MAGGIFCVPTGLRQIDEGAYTPRVVAIGPLHRGLDPKLEEIQQLKESYQSCLLHRRNPGPDPFRSISERANSLRQAYREQITSVDDKIFTDMLILDGCFILEIMYRTTIGAEEYDTLISSPLRVHDIARDLLLIENQIPFEILQRLHPLFWFDNNSLNFLILSFFNNTLFRNQPVVEGNGTGNQTIHLVDFFRQYFTTANPSIVAYEGGVPRLSDLKLAGVRLKPITNSGFSFVDVNFVNGVLEVPVLTLNRETTSVFRNLIAFEQNDRRISKCLSDYVYLMDSLVDTANDARLLRTHGVIKSSLGDDEEVSQLFNDLARGIILTESTFVYSKLCADLMAYSKRGWNKNRADLLGNYFNSPWTVISALAAVSLLIMTFFQTIFSYYSLVAARE